MFKKIKAWYFFNIDSNYLLLSLLIIFALILRVYKLDFQSFWFEELMTINYSEGSSLVDFFHRYYKTPDASPPLYPFLVYSIRLLYPYSDWMLRLPSVLFGTGVVAMTFFLGKKLVNEATGIFALLCTVSSGALIYYSKELRYNSCLVFFILTFTYLFVENFNGNKRKGLKLLLIVNVFILLFLHYVGLIFMLEIIFFALSLRVNNRKIFFKYLGMVFLIVLAFSPWLSVFVNQFKTWTIQKEINNAPHLMGYMMSMVDFSFFYKNYWERRSFAISQALFWIRNYAYLFFAFVLTFYFYLNLKLKNKISSYSDLSLNKMIVWGIFPLNILMFFILDSIGSNKYFYEKNLLFTLPFIYIFIGQVLSFVFTKKECILIGFFILSTSLYNDFFIQKNQSEIFKTEFKQSTDFIAANSIDVPVYVVCGDRRWYNYYFKKNDIKNIIFNKDIRLNEILKAHKEFWIVCNHGFLSLNLDLELSKISPAKSYPSQTLAYAKLFKIE